MQTIADEVVGCQLFLSHKDSMPRIISPNGPVVVTASMLDNAGRYFVQPGDGILLMQTGIPWTVILPMSPTVAALKAGGNSTPGQVNQNVTVVMDAPSAGGVGGFVTSYDLSYDGVYFGEGYQLASGAGVVQTFVASLNSFGGFTWRLKNNADIFRPQIGPLALVAGVQQTGAFLVPIAASYVAGGGFRSLQYLGSQLDALLAVGSASFGIATPFTQSSPIMPVAGGGNGFSNGTYDPPFVPNRTLTSVPNDFGVIVTWSAELAAGSTPGTVNMYPVVTFW